MNIKNEIQALLQKFQDGYIHRNVSRLSEFMELFHPECEIIGTAGANPGVGEWYLNRDTARSIFHGNWKDWGDLRIDISKVTVKVQGEVGWMSFPGTVTMEIGEDNYEEFFEVIKEIIAAPNIDAKQKLLDILRGGTNTVFELNRGSKFIWPIRITAVVAKYAERLVFTQMAFSFSTTRFPDERIIDGKVIE